MCVGNHCESIDLTPCCEVEAARAGTGSMPRVCRLEVWILAIMIYAMLLYIWEKKDNIQGIGKDVGPLSQRTPSWEIPI